MDVQELLSGASDLWRRHRVTFAYLFGSEARDTARDLSDIDIAAYLDESLEQGSWLRVRLALLADLAELTRSDRVDVVILNEAPIVLAYGVLRDGKVVYSADERARRRHWAKIVDRYIDMEPMRRTLAEGTRHRLEEGRFGRS